MFFVSISMVGFLQTGTGYIVRQKNPAQIPAAIPGPVFLPMVYVFKMIKSLRA